MAYDSDPHTKFNAGVDTALYINMLLKRCGYYSSTGDFTSWHNTLREVHRWVSPKLEKKQGQKEDVQNKSKDNNHVLQSYQKKITKHKKIPASLLYGVYDYLSDYETVLRKYIDKLGYQMPETEDPRFAL